MLCCNCSVGNAWGRQDPKVGLETLSSSSALDLAPRGSLRKVTWRFPFTWTHPPRSKLLAVAEVFLGSGVAVLGKAEHKRDFRLCWAVLCLQCSWKGWWASFPLPHGLSVPAASCAGAGSVSQGDKGSLCAQGERLVQPCTEWCCSCSVPGPALPVPAWRYEVQEGSCPCWEQPGGQDGSSVLETTPWLCPEAACSDQPWADHNKFRCLRDRSRDCAWVPLSWVPVCWGCGLGGSCCLE